LLRHGLTVDNNNANVVDSEKRNVVYFVLLWISLVDNDLS
jgi:hypothetical protein